jgi:hypothetical protein
MVVRRESGLVSFNTHVCTLDPFGGLRRTATRYRSRDNTRRVLVPEPSTWAMMVLGFAGLAFAGWRRAAKREAALA